MPKDENENVQHRNKQNKNGADKHGIYKQSQCKDDDLLRKIGAYILRHHNWICVLILTPISLIYDVYCNGEKKYFIKFEM